MRIKKTFLIALFLNLSLLAQVNFRAGMGLDFFSSPSMIDYINQSNFTEGSDLSSFLTAINLSGEIGLNVADDIQLALELAYKFYSYNANIALGKYDLEFNNISPSLITYYVFEGKGYNLKLGAGAGVRFINVQQKLPASVSAEKFSNLGYGFLLRSQGNTILGENLFANISLDIGYDFNGVPLNDNRKLYNNVLKEDVNFNQLIFGIKLGLYYEF